MENNTKMVNFLNYLLDRDEYDKRSNYIEIERYLNYSLDRNIFTPQETKFANYILNLSKFRKGKIINFNNLYEEFMAKNKNDLER